MANPIKTCWLCGTEAELSREHIAPNQLGFTATTHSFSCHGCNSKMGKLEEKINDFARIANTIKAYSRADNDLDRMPNNRDPRNKPWTDSEGRKLLGDRITFESDAIEEPFEGTLKSMVESSSSQPRGLWMFLAAKGALARISLEKGLSECYRTPELHDALDRLRRYVNDPQPSAWQGLPYIEAQPWGPLGIARLMIYCPREENTRLPSIYGALMYSSLFTWFRLADNVENCPPFALDLVMPGMLHRNGGEGYTDWQNKMQAMLDEQMAHASVVPLGGVQRYTLEKSGLAQAHINYGMHAPSLYLPSGYIDERYGGPSKFAEFIRTLGDGTRHRELLRTESRRLASWYDD